MSLANTPWLSNWRKYADETDMSPRDRRVVQQAIQQAEQGWVQKHEEAYRGLADRRFHTRDEGVVGAAEGMSARLAEIRRDVKAGRMKAKEARAAVRTMRGQYDQARELHETLIGQEERLKEFAAMAPDDYQRSFAEKFPVLTQNAPTLAGVVAQMAEVPPGGSLHRIEGAPGEGAPSVEDLTA